MLTTTTKLGKMLPPIQTTSGFFVPIQYANGSISVSRPVRPWHFKLAAASPTVASSAPPPQTSGNKNHIVEQEDIPRGQNQLAFTVPEQARQPDLPPRYTTSSPPAYVLHRPVYSKALLLPPGWDEEEQYDSDSDNDWHREQEREEEQSDRNHFDWVLVTLLICNVLIWGMVFKLYVYDHPEVDEHAWQMMDRVWG